MDPGGKGIPRTERSGGAGGGGSEGVKGHGVPWELGCQLGLHCG